MAKEKNHVNDKPDEDIIMSTPKHPRREWEYFCLHCFQIQKTI
jgi:hypothetical protein